MQKLDKSLLGVTGEYFVAAELGRRGFYVQLTLGNQKRMDLLVFSELSGKFLKIEVKTKQQERDWPQCKGIGDKNSIIVFIDFYGIAIEDRPKCYILTYEDWLSVAEQKLKEHLLQYPDSQSIIEDGILIRPERNNRKGFGVREDYVKHFKDKWEKVTEKLT